MPALKGGDHPLKKRSKRASVSKSQDMKRWKWLKNKVNQLSERLPQDPPFPQGSPEEPESFRRSQDAMSRNDGPDWPPGFDGGFGFMDVPIGPPPRMDERSPGRTEERSRGEQGPRRDDWWDGPMEWSPQEETPPQGSGNSRSNRARSSPQTESPQRFTEEWDEPEEDASGKHLSHHRDWEDLPTMFDETETLDSSNFRRRRRQTRKR